MFQRLLVPLDGSPFGEASLPLAEAQARAFDACLVLLHVVTPSPGGADLHTAWVSFSEAQARAYLEAIAVGLAQRGLRVETVVVPQQDSVAQTVIDESETLHADLIVLATHGRTGLARLVLGSVAEEIVRHAPCPVLLVRPKEAPAQVGRPLRSFDADAARAGPLQARPLGIRTVELARIIGSVGRAHELGPDFRPLRRHPADDARFEGILRAMERGEALPPVQLYKLGYGYYVLDGNHRVAAARRLGQMEIDAVVTEFIPLGDSERAQVFQERQAFERATGLTRVGASRPGHYPRLEALVREYAAQESAALQETPVAPTFQEMARRWYTEFFVPMARRIRALGLARYFPGERTADILVHVADFRRQEQARLGRPLRWDEALDQFVKAFCAEQGRSTQRRFAGLRELLRRRRNEQRDVVGL
jgi:nucleotide-binding universal stress UspA family protein